MGNCSCAIALSLAALAPQEVAPATTSKLSCWDTPRRGANYALTDVDPARDFADARAYGMNVLRLTVPGVPRDWPEERDYFADERFESDLRIFDTVLEKAAAADLRVIVVASSVPGRQWLWYTHGRGDRRLWRNERWHDELADYWSKLARRYRDHPAVIAYELLNEPSPEVLAERETWNRAELEKFYESTTGTAADLNALYRRLVAAVSEQDPKTPIVLDASLWASPLAFFALAPISGDARVLYSFHWYGPESFTIWRENQGAHSYPGCASEELGASGAPERVLWNAETLRARMVEPIHAWQTEHGVPSSRILCGEFSADRRAPGADRWNRDVLALFEERGWHWTYYCFRERDWDAKDFELGPAPDARERSANPMMKTFADLMARNHR